MKTSKKLEANPVVVQQRPGSAVGGDFYNGVEWLACWLLDNAEGETITEEQLRPWAAKAWEAYLKQQEARGFAATSELSEIINAARERGCAEHGHEIKLLLELPMTDEEWKRFNELTGWPSRKQPNVALSDKARQGKE